MQDTLSALCYVASLARPLYRLAVLGRPTRAVSFQFSIASLCLEGTATIARTSLLRTDPAFDCHLTRNRVPDVKQ